MTAGHGGGYGGHGGGYGGHGGGYGGHGGGSYPYGGGSSGGAGNFPFDSYVLKYSERNLLLEKKILNIKSSYKNLV